jgi:uncharacterized protein YndB with AHSA1/START domain
VISTSVRIAAPPEVVFPYFTDPKLMVTWIGERVDLDARPGGTFALDFSGVAARCRPGAARWRWCSSPTAPTRS